MPRRLGGHGRAWWLWHTRTVPRRPVRWPFGRPPWNAYLYWQAQKRNPETGASVELVAGEVTRTMTPFPLASMSSQPNPPLDVAWVGPEMTGPRAAATAPQLASVPLLPA